MEFLLECVGFSPQMDLDTIQSRIRREGESVPYRGPGGEHLRAKLAAGVELRLDLEEGDDIAQLFPYYDVKRRLRVRVRHLASVPDSPFDAQLIGVANPPVPGESWVDSLEREDYVLSTYLTDARRLPPDLPEGHVLAVSVAGFALDVEHVGPEPGPVSSRLFESPDAASIQPLGELDAPGASVELALVVREVKHVTNPWSGQGFDILTVEAPGRALELFISRWQLEADGVPAPRPGWRIEGTFLFTGRISGGLPQRRRARSTV